MGQHFEARHRKANTGKLINFHLNCRASGAPLKLKRNQNKKPAQGTKLI